MLNKQELIKHIATKLNGFGYSVYLSKDGRYGFYTDGVRVVSFGGQWNFSVDFTGNYRPSVECGTGWQLAKERSDITKEEADSMIKANALYWTGNKNPVYSTPEQHLKTYGASSGYVLFECEKPLEWQALWDAMDAKPNDWIETTEEMFWNMLECVPPRAQEPSRFLVGEALRTNDAGENVHSCFKECGGRYFAKNMTVAQFKERVTA
jgi:hypothetical protein